MGSKLRATEPDGFNAKPRASEDDVEGHGFKMRATEPDGFNAKPRASEPEGFNAKPRASEDDVEGHMMSNPLLGRELARARESEIQRNLKAHTSRDEATRPHKK